MNKSILAAAIAAGLMVPGLAAADVKIYGTIQAETGNVDVDNQGAIADTDTTLMGSSANGAINGGGPNTLGFKGTEKLGNGMTAYFKIATQFETFDNNAGNGIEGRETYVGVKGDGWHTQFGRMNSLYKTASHKWDPFVATGLQQRATGAVSQLHNAYIDNVGEIGFKSGNWSGGAQLKWEDGTDNVGGNLTAGTDDTIDAGSWNGRIVYKDGPWNAFFTYMDQDYSTGGDTNAWKAGVKYAANGWSVAGVYEDLDASRRAPGGLRPDGVSNFFVGNGGNGGTGTIDDYDSLSIDVTYKLSDSTTLLGTYANFDIDRTTNVDTDGDQWNIGVTHSLTKRTSVYGGYMDVEHDENRGGADRDIDAWALGMRHKF